MKKTFITLIAATCMLMQPLLATSVMEGRGQDAKVEAATPRAHAELGKAASESEMTRALDIQDATTFQNPSANNDISGSNQDISGSSTSEIVNQKSHKAKVTKEKKQRIRPFKLLKKLKQQEGDSILGILALVFGILGFIIAWVFFPLGLLFAIAAIVLGAIGMGGGRSGRGMAIGGLILGILTIVIPILIVALILAILL